MLSVQILMSFLTDGEMERKKLVIHMALSLFPWEQGKILLCMKSGRAACL